VVEDPRVEEANPVKASHLDGTIFMELHSIVALGMYLPYGEGEKQLYQFR